MTRLLSIRMPTRRAGRLTELRRKTRGARTPPRTPLVERELLALDPLVRRCIDDSFYRDLLEAGMLVTAVEVVAEVLTLDMPDPRVRPLALGLLWGVERLEIEGEGPENLRRILLATGGGPVRGSASDGLSVAT